MNLSPKWVMSLASYGIEAVHWSAVGEASAADIKILEYAHVNNFTILTHDLDFSAIIAGNRLKKPSIIQLRTGDINPDNAAPLVINAIQQAAPEIDSGAILTIELNKSRLRILPLFQL